jgi:putative nucleotidyltransferase-like protein
MSMGRLARYSELAGYFALTAEVDALTAEVVGAFAGEGIDTVVLKGPVLARWLYPGEVRPYVDSDLLVAPEDRARAVSVLERLGFEEHCPWMPVPLSLDPGGTAFDRPGGGTVDLHCQLPGLDGDPDAIWDRLAASAGRQVIAGVELQVPDRDTVLLHVALHAAHHANMVGGNPLEDLRRALALLEEAEWSGALELARAYHGVPAFAAGLRLLPEGEDLARRLDLGEVRSFQHEIRREDNVIAEELYALLSADTGIRKKLVIAASDIFPLPDYMRWWSPLARRGKLGLAGAYLWRVIWIIGQAPRAIHTLWRIQRAKGLA